MLRVLIVFALLLPALADVQARGFRFSVRPRAVGLATRPTLRPVERTPSSSRVVYGRDRQEPAQARSALDQPTTPAAPAAVSAAPPVATPSVMKSVDRASHWCDNGAIVGSGAGFCVIKIKGDDPT